MEIDDEKGNAEVMLSVATNIDRKWNKAGAESGFTVVTDFYKHLDIDRQKLPQIPE
ncbi:MAG: hypothetical protein GY795_33600 [Desulfobacterales bacterium]|nr:hypothetical protein [Desulfobacterales bacterium]